MSWVLKREEVCQAKKGKVFKTRRPVSAKSEAPKSKVIKRNGLHVN